jgi:hypothetical protein
MFVLAVHGTTYGGDTDTSRSLGVMLGDPMAITLHQPVNEKASFNIHAGIWTWSFWHDIKYDTPYLSIDYVILRPINKIPLLAYIGGGFAFFLDDNPKDDDDYDASVAVRIPFGFEFFKNKDFSIGFEIAPIYQFAPSYSAEPYGIELNGGLTIGYSF